MGTLGWLTRGRVALVATACMVGVVGSSACVDRKSDDNDGDAGLVRAMDGSLPDGSDAARGRADGDARSSEDDPDAAASDDPGFGDDTPDPTSAAIEGSAVEAGCSSYQPPASGMCAGYYCGVDEAALAAAIDPSAKCGGYPEYACSGELIGVVGACTRTAKSSMPFANETQLRSAIATCVKQDENAQYVPDDCLGCFLDSAICASSHCLIQCASGDSPTCDQCRLDHQCAQPVFACAGLPSPL